jgi:hypothetical protein
MKTVIEKEVAIVELGNLVNKYVKKHVRTPATNDDLEKGYPDVLDAIMDGFLSFDKDGLPVYKLSSPIKTDSGDVTLSEVTFKTRIKPLTLADLAKGLNPQTEVFTLQLRMTAYIIGEPLSMLDKFSAYDYDVISQVGSIFS